MRSLVATTFFFCLAVSACSQTPVVVPLRSMERPRDVDFICLQEQKNGTWEGVSLEKCALAADGTQEKGAEGNFRLHSVVTQQSRGELAVVDLGKVRGDPAALLKIDPRIPGYSFIPVGAAPTDVVADPMGKAVFISSGRDPRIDVLPSGLLRGPVDTTASVDPPPWPHIDFDRATEGMPSAMSIHRVDDTRRLFVTLPDATPLAKIAVFDLTNPLVPARVGDITLAAPDASPLPFQPVRCGPYAGSFDPTYLTAKKATAETWWAAYDRCGGETPKTPVGASTVDPANKDFHFAGVAIAGGKLFVADDHVPLIHVFDIDNGKGIEIRRIAIGAPTSRLAVSPPVPDEVTIENVAAVDVCTANGWLGDGRDHSTESSTVKELLAGRCRLHRYIYGVDLVNTDAGGGSIAVVDVPITYALDDKNAVATVADKLTGELLPKEERLDIDGAELAQPMACDSPTFFARRLPLGPFAVGGINAVPARSISFVTTDPSINNIKVNATTAVKAARCRGWAPGTYPRASATVRDLDAADGVPADQRTARIAAGEAWRSGVDPRRLRGVFAWVALSNGALVIVDVDDYDATCRGPTKDEKRGKNGVQEKLFAHPDEADFELTNAAVAEWFPRTVKRHHPRSLRVFSRDVVPVATTATLSRYNNILTNDPQTDNGYVNPHFAGIEKQDPAELRPVTISAAPDNPYALSTEAWAVTYEGALPGFQGAFGSIAEGGPQLEFRDPAAAFCRKGVESDGAVETHDVVQILDDVCAFDDRCTPAEKARCLEIFGESTAQPLARTRSLLVDKAFDDRLRLANKRFVRSGGGPEDYALQDGAPDLANIKSCFGSTVGGTRVLPLLKYAVRSSKSWVVVGGVSGFLHRKMVDPTSTDKACINDLSRPRIQNGRAGEISPLDKSVIDSKDPPYSKAENVIGKDDKTLDCRQFVNPTWKFAIRAGGAPSRQDMRFTFTGRFAWQPLSLGAGSLTASMRPVAGFWNGKERLNWSMIAVVDAIDRGLLVFPTDTPFAFQKGAN